MLRHKPPQTHQIKKWLYIIRRSVNLDWTSQCWTSNCRLGTGLFQITVICLESVSYPGCVLLKMMAEVQEGQTETCYGPLKPTWAQNGHTIVSAWFYWLEQIPLASPTSMWWGRMFHLQGKKLQCQVIKGMDTGKREAPRRTIQTTTVR